MNATRFAELVRIGADVYNLSIAERCELDRLLINCVAEAQALETYSDELRAKHGRGAEKLSSDEDAFLSELCGAFARVVAPEQE